MATGLRIAIILGTRPEIIKMSPIIRECKNRGVNFFQVHTGQHYSYNMDRVFFEQIHLPEPDYKLEVGSGSHGRQTGEMLSGIEEILQRETPDVALVEGDTNTVLAGALAACKLGIEVGHVEAGLRSYDRRMPEETNRVVADHCSDYLFAPTEKSRKILLGEGISDRKISVVGNTVVDAVFHNLVLAGDARPLLEKFGLRKQGYFLATAHRQENVDNPQRLRDIVRGLEMVSKEFDAEVVYPIHPRTSRRMVEFGIGPQSIKLVEPLDYLSFLQLEQNASLVLTDSGGVQEESCIIGVPCVTLRDNTERPETIEVGSNTLAGTRPQDIVAGVKTMLDKRMNWDNPFGDGKTSERIVDILSEVFEEKAIAVRNHLSGFA